MPKKPTKRKAVRKREIVCAKCGATFYHSHSQAKYCSPKCKQLGLRDSWNRYAKANRAERRRHGRRMYLKNVDVVLARTRAYQRSPAGKRAAKKGYLHQLLTTPERVIARMVVRYALKLGILKRERCRCGSRQQAHAHHPDYSDPLRVIWLCPPCHREEHRRIDGDQ